MKQLHFTRLDYVTLALFALVLAVVIVLRRFGL